jgi:hypothetical protein
MVPSLHHLSRRLQDQSAFQRMGFQRNSPPSLYQASPLSFPHPPQYDEDIPAVDVARRTRPRGADTAVGGSGSETDDAVRAGVTASLIRFNMMALQDARCLHPYELPPLVCALTLFDNENPATTASRCDAGSSSKTTAARPGPSTGSFATVCFHAPPSLCFFACALLTLVRRGYGRSLERLCFGKEVGGGHGRVQRAPR